MCFIVGPWRGRRTLATRANIAPTDTPCNVRKECRDDADSIGPGREEPGRLQPPGDDPGHDAVPFGGEMVLVEEEILEEHAAARLHGEQLGEQIEYRDAMFAGERR